MNYAQQVYDIALEEREKYAQAIHNVSHVKSLIEARAYKGYRHIRIYQKHAYTLENTRATRFLLSWLKDERFTTTWDEAVAEFDARRPRSAITFLELIIKWS